MKDFILIKIKHVCRIRWMKSHYTCFEESSRLFLPETEKLVEKVVAVCLGMVLLFITLCFI